MEFCLMCSRWNRYTQLLFLSWNEIRNDAIWIRFVWPKWNIHIYLFFFLVLFWVRVWYYVYVREHLVMAVRGTWCVYSVICSIGKYTLFERIWFHNNRFRLAGETFKLWKIEMNKLWPDLHLKRDAGCPSSKLFFLILNLWWWWLNSALRLMFQ